MTKTRLVSLLLIPVILLLAYGLFAGIKSSIDLAEEITASEKRVQQKLMMIRSAQKAHLSKYNNYASTWDSLTLFLKSDTIYETQKREIITPRSQDDPLFWTGTDSIRVEIDTINASIARQALFPIEQYPNFEPANLRYIPGTDNKEFDMYVAEIERSGTRVDVIEVVDRYPYDRRRYDEKNGEINPNPKRMYLRFGSRNEVTTAGNWE